MQDIWYGTPVKGKSNPLKGLGPTGWELLSQSEWVYRMWKVTWSWAKSHLSRHEEVLILSGWDLWQYPSFRLNPRPGNLRVLQVELWSLIAILCRVGIPPGKVLFIYLVYSCMREDTWTCACYHMVEDRGHLYLGMELRSSGLAVDTLTTWLSYWPQLS